MRIAIIGCGGSGKTTLARRLGTALQAPVTHLDALHYDDEWNTLPKDEFAALQEERVAQERWVIDGNFASTLPIRLQRATEVIFLDLPPITCLSGIAQRRLKYGGGQDDRTGVHDRVHWGFIKYVWNYRKTMGPRVRNLILEHGTHANVRIVRSRRAANRLVEHVISGQGTQDRLTGVGRAVRRMPLPVRHRPHAGTQNSVRAQPATADTRGPVSCAVLLTVWSAC